MKIILTNGRFLLRKGLLKIVMKTLIFLLCTTIFALSPNNIVSQNSKIRIDADKILTVDEVFDLIMAQTDYKFFYEEGIFNDFPKVQLKKGVIRTNKLLSQSLSLGDLDVTLTSSNAILIKEKPKPDDQQNITVTGTVTNEAGEPLIGANIIEKNTNNGAQTDFDGKFALKVSNSDAILVISYLGFTSQEVPVENQTTFNITLKEDASELNEVIVVGYTTQRRTTVTGAVADINMDAEIGKRPIANISQMLQGNVANLNVSTNNSGGEPGATSNINIRGLGTLTGNGGQPYILLDGLPITPSQMNSINPYDIENVSVLKDAASAAIYGSRGAYGVILITTKQGKKGRIKVDYSNNFAFATPTVLPKIANSLEWATAYNDAAANQGSAPVFNDQTLQNIRDYAAGARTDDTEPNDTGTAWRYYTDGYANYDWYDVIFKNYTPRQQHKLSVSGGLDKTTFYLSGNFFEQLGNIEFADDKYNRYNFTLNLKTEATDWLRFNVSTKYSREKKHFPSGGFGGYDKNIIYHQISRMWPMNPLYAPDGSILNYDILRIQKSGVQNDYTKNLILQGGIEIEPIKNWITRISYNYNTNSFNNDRLELRNLVSNPDGTTRNVGNNPDEISRYFSEGQTQLFNITSNYKMSFNNHNIDVLIGAEQRQTESVGLYGRKRELITENVPTISTAVGDLFTDDDLSHYSTRGFFTSISYNFDEKYLIEGKVRIDESSYFKPGNRKGIFPGVSLGYIISKENFWEPLKSTVNSFKLRGSWGQLGNHDPSLANRFVELMGTGLSSWLLNGIRPNIVTAPGLISPNLTWETSTTYNLGFDAGLFNNQIEMSFEWYNRTTSDMIGPVQSLPAALGTSAPIENNAELETKGWELNLKHRGSIGKLDYHLGINIGDNQSTVTKYTNPTGTLNDWFAGSKTGNIWGFETVGLFQSDDAAANAPDQTRYWSTWGAGDVQYADLDGNDRISPEDFTLDNHGDYKILGNSTPRYNYGVNLGLSYKGFDLSVLVQGIGKRDFMFSRTTNLFWGFRGSMWQNTITKASLDYWSPENTGAYFPKPYMGSQHFKNTRTQSRYLQDASYTRLKNIQLTYTFPSEITSKIGLSNAQIYVSGDNLLTFTKLNENFDPETLGGGFGSGKIYPLQKVLSFGVNLGL